MASKKTQQVQQRLALAAQAAAQGNHAAAAAYAQAAANIQGSGQAKVQAVANQYAQIATQAATPAPTPAAPTPTPAAPTPAGPNPAETNYWNQQSAAAEAARQAALNQNLSAAKAMIDTYGMGSLWAGVDKLIRAGYTDLDTINTMLSQDANYQQAYYDRFPAVKTIRELNKQRTAQGLPPVAEPTAKGYVELEKAYRQALKDLPGTFGTAGDIAQWIVKDVSPTEVADRAAQAKNYITYSANGSIKEQLRKIYGMSDAEMASYVLAPDRTLEMLKSEYNKRMAQATVGGAGIDAGLSLRDETRDMIAQNEAFGQSYANTLAQMNSVKEIDDAYARLGRLSGVTTSTDELVTDQFGLKGAEAVTEKKKQLASQERARFSGSSGIGKTSLSAGRLAQ